MNHRLQCRCGNVRGHVILPVSAGRAVCYCRDCRAYANYLRQPGVLDVQGGTDIVATLPSHVRFERGVEHMACMSLKDGGLLRWYAGCCRTPLGNTPRDRKVHYVGLVHSCLDRAALDRDFGPVQVRLNTASALGPVESTPMASVRAVIKLMASMVPARFSGRYKDNPFFDPHRGRPLREPHVLSEAERSTLREAA